MTSSWMEALKEANAEAGKAKIAEEQLQSLQRRMKDCDTRIMRHARARDENVQRATDLYNAEFGTRYSVADFLLAGASCELDLAGVQSETEPEYIVDEESNLVKHARRELAIIGEYPEDWILVRL